MRFGAILPDVGDLAMPYTLIGLVRQSEDLGFDGVFLSDHLTAPAAIESRYPYRSDGVFPPSWRLIRKGREERVKGT